MFYLTGREGSINKIKWSDCMIISENVAFTDQEAEQFFNALPVKQKMQFLTTSESPSVGGEATEETALIGKETPVVIAFADGVAPEKRQAVMNIAQLSEAYADIKANRKTNALAWYEAYHESMQACGWTFTNYIYTTHDTKNVNVTMDSLVLEIVAMAAGMNAAAIVPLLGNVFDRIKKDNAIITLFDNNSKGSSVGSCQIMPCIESEGGIAVTVLAGLECTFNSSEGGAWFWKWKASSLSVQKAATQMNLNFDSYKRREHHILGQLDKSSDDFFANINLK